MNSRIHVCSAVERCRSYESRGQDNKPPNPHGALLSAEGHFRTRSFPSKPFCRTPRLVLVASPLKRRTVPTLSPCLGLGSPAIQLSETSSESPEGLWLNRAGYPGAYPMRGTHDPWLGSQCHVRATRLPRNPGPPRYLSTRTGHGAGIDPDRDGPEVSADLSPFRPGSRIPPSTSSRGR